MRPSSEARWGVVAVLALHLLTASAGVVLLGRTSTAVERILAENVYSTMAVEEMLAALALPGKEEAFVEALRRAQNNVTEPDEVPALQTIDRVRTDALTGDPEAREEAVAALRSLSAVNHTSMHRADHHARRIGLAGAWFMALLGFLGFSLSLVVYRRMMERLLAPFGQIGAVLEAARQGETFRRASPAGLEPHAQAVVDNLNWLLDHRLAVTSADSPSDPSCHVALVALLDRWSDRPAAIRGPDGSVLATNALCWGEGDHRQALALLASGGTVAGWESVPLAEGIVLHLGPPVVLNG